MWPSKRTWCNHRAGDPQQMKKEPSYPAKAESWMSWCFGQPSLPKMFQQLGQWSIQGAVSTQRYRERDISPRKKAARGRDGYIRSLLGYQRFRVAV